MRCGAAAGGLRKAERRVKRTAAEEGDGGGRVETHCRRVGGRADGGSGRGVLIQSLNGNDERRQKKRYLSDKKQWRVANTKTKRVKRVMQGDETS